MKKGIIGSLIKFLSRINNRIGRGNVRVRQRKDKYIFDHAYKDLTKKELVVVTRVEKLAVDFRNGIKYVINDNGLVVKTLIEIPDGLVIMQSGKIELYNHEGFAFAIIPDEAYERVRIIVDREANRERRRIENQYNENYISFVEKLGKVE